MPGEADQLTPIIRLRGNSEVLVAQFEPPLKAHKLFDATLSTFPVEEIVSADTRQHDIESIRYKRKLTGEPEERDQKEINQVFFEGYKAVAQGLGRTVLTKRPAETTVPAHT